MNFLQDQQTNEKDCFRLYRNCKHIKERGMKWCHIIISAMKQLTVAVIEKFRLKSYSSIFLLMLILFICQFSVIVFFIKKIL